MRKFISKLLLFLLPYLIFYMTIFIFNLKIDAYCIFARAHVLERITDDLLSGKIVSGRPSFQYRVFEKLIINKRKLIPHTIVLGASPTFVLRASHLGLDQKSFFNHTVPAATLKDFIAILGCYKEKGALPKTVIFGLSPYMFYSNLAGDKRWQFIASNYYYFLPFIMEDTSQLKLFYERIKAEYIRVRQLKSWGRAKANYKYFKEVRKKGFDYMVVKNKSVDDFLILPDGSLYRPFKLRFQQDSVTRSKVEKASRRTMPRIKNRGQIVFEKTFRNLIDYLLANGTQVVFYLPPYHPYTYQKYKQEGVLEYFIEVEEMLRSLAQPRKILILGAYDPSRFNLSNQDFIDEVHSREHVAENIFKEYQEVAGE